MPRDIDGIIDEIDRLVDDQLDGGEPKRGYSFGDPTFPRCWHCGRHEHHLPITARIAAMYARGTFDESYLADEDDSPVLCQGSDFIGPMPDNPARDLVSALSARAIAYAQMCAAEVLGLRDVFGHLPDDPFDPSDWFTPERLVNHQGEVICDASQDTLGPEWTFTTDAANARAGAGPVTEVDSGQPLTRTGPAPWDHEFNPQRGHRISIERNGVVETFVVTDVEPGESSGETTVTLGRERPGIGIRADLGWIGPDGFQALGMMHDEDDE